MARNCGLNRHFYFSVGEKLTFKKISRLRSLLLLGELVFGRDYNSRSDVSSESLMRGH